MSANRRLLLQAVALAVAIVSVFALLSVVLKGNDDPPVAAASQDLVGPVLLVPGYGGATGALQVLAQSLRTAGRVVSIVASPGDGTGDLALSVAALDAAATATNAPAVDIVGYSAGGVIARMWASQNPSQARRVITLGSPHHGTKLAALGALLTQGACSVACQQLVPGSDLLDALNEDETPAGPQWLTLWTIQDETVTPPDSARLDGAVNLELQQLCPALTVSHADLPRNPTVIRIVLGALSGPAIGQPTAAVC